MDDSPTSIKNRDLQMIFYQINIDRNIEYSASHGKRPYPDRNCSTRCCTNIITIKQPSQCREKKSEIIVKLYQERWKSFLKFSYLHLFYALHCSIKPQDFKKCFFSSFLCGIFGFLGIFMQFGQRLYSGHLNNCEMQTFVPQVRK